MPVDPLQEERSRQTVTFEELQLKLQRLDEQLAELQVQNADWEQKISDLEKQLLISQERQDVVGQIDDMQLELDTRQKEITRLKGVTAEYRRILSRKEILMAKYDEDLAAAQALIQLQREKIEFYRSAANIPEQATEMGLETKAARDISAD